jgi:gliding motility-associated-like protein
LNLFFGYGKISEIRIKLVFILVLWCLTGNAQYFNNPSFEGPYPSTNTAPPGWENCTGSPDIQPFAWDVPTEPSDGESYVGMCWLPYWIERIWTPLAIPLNADSCYKFEIDLAFYFEINYYGDIQSTFPMKIQIMGSTYFCTDGVVLWESPYIGHLNWLTYEFVVEPEVPVNNIMIRTYYDQAMPDEIGYMLMDNIRVSTPPDIDLGNDTTICNNDSIMLYPGPGFDEYIWQDGSNDSIYYATQAGVYWVEGITDYGCSRFDTIVIEQSPDIDLGPDTTICIGDTIELAAGAGYEQYLWFNGSSDSTLQLWDVGQYLVWVIVTDSLGCTGIDSLHLSIINDSTTVSIGPDTLMCKGTGYTLNPGDYLEYLWQDSATTSIFIVTEPGEYWVQVLGDCGYASDTVNIDFFPEIELDLGSDTLVCDDITLLLDAGEGFEEYVWQDGSTQQTYEVNGTGIYWVTVTDEHGCNETDTIHVALSPAVVVDLGSDTTVCSNDQFALSPGEGFTSYVWQDGSTNPFYMITNPGMYWVEVTDDIGCSGSDTINIGLNPSPEVSLGSDTTLCEGGVLTLDPGFQYNSYMWQDNSTLPVFIVTSSGYYSVTVTNIFECPASDEIFVDFSSPQVTLGGDTILCLGDTLFLNAGEGYSSYMWQDSSTAQIYQVIGGGIYFVQVTDEFNCSGQDAVEIEPIPKPVADLGQDRPICIGETIILEAQQGPYYYLWNGKPGGTFLEISEGGTYTLEVSNQCGAVTDEVTITEYPVPVVDLGEDRILQAGETIELDAGAGFNSYLWQDGGSTRFYLITPENTDPENPYYYVEVTQGPCKSSDTAKITLLKVKIPNVITPNGDGINDTFTPMDGSWSGVSKHHIGIYNRWGEKVWESDNFEEGWDAKRNGVHVSEGTYYWVLEIFYGEDQLSQRLKGTVTVLGTQ